VEPRVDEINQLIGAGVKKCIVGGLIVQHRKPHTKGGLRQCRRNGSQVKVATMLIIA
jgi:hypothetical protein